jgi:hypothetical protein
MRKKIKPQVKKKQIPLVTWRKSLKIERWAAWQRPLLEMPWGLSSNLREKYR